MDFTRNAKRSVIAVSREKFKKELFRPDLRKKTGKMGKKTLKIGFLQDFMKIDKTDLFTTVEKPVAQLNKK